MKNLPDVKAFLFARWISTCYADDYLDDKMRHTSNKDFDGSTAMCILNRESGKWWRTRFQYFNNIVYPNYINNGSVTATKEFLS